MKTTDGGFPGFLADCQRRIEAALAARLPGEDIHPQSLHRAMRYATLNGGKRIRPVLVYAAGQAVGAAPEALDAPACAVEFIHAYSLVHDDLPAMDDDDLRRGNPTCHKVYGEAEAILAGDALQALAFHTLAHDPDMAADAAARLRMIEQLALAAGSRGMVGGQSIDLAAVGRELSLLELEDMHIHKTGALIRVSVLLGALSRPDCPEPQLQALDRYAKCLGLAFQIQDDVLDVEGDTAVLGKTAGSDQDRNKPTYPALLGLAEAKQRARDLIDEAREALSEFGAEAAPLQGLADHLLRRSH
ncbi:(2E,6E)-farnesyl diphosphate synthase [Thiohalobacter sp. COW1]|uniref:(2E,6E)-farnesyl diphosphate synthase n=1 Tax=Thiohalobacter sp. COW1 TaxID=2795687 RepID=UPI00193777D5|nr:farnesyl diphosphate synthase [Thiohalobacter sp. COW1]BCO31365.1 (2E,6E)-farnesyl diphosphate synthase [Thiohalobacter sp. COW1]